MIVTNRVHFPVAVVLVAGEMTFADIATMKSFYDEMHARERRFATVVDARRSRAPGAPVRKALAEMSNGFAERSRKNLVSTATVLDHAILVGALTAVRWFLETEIDLRYFSTAGSAWAHVEPLLRAERLDVPAAARAFVESLDTRAAAQTYADEGP